VAFGIAGEHPLLGIGPDNFRHTYGRRLGLAAWDERVHANNSYIEMLVGMGVAGLLATAWLMFAALRSGTRALVDVSEARLPIVAASFAACAAIAVHALVDSFLTFTPTYAVFAIAAGMLFSAPSSPEGEPC
jgi:O-antigen ligase